MLQGKTDFNSSIRPDIQHDLMLRSYQRSAVKPTTRQDGSPLVIGDLWRDTSSSDLFDWEWNGLYWLSPPYPFNFPYGIFSAPGSSGSPVNHQFTFDLLQVPSSYDVIIDELVVAIFSPFNTNNDVYFSGYLYYHQLTGNSPSYPLYEAKSFLVGWNSLSVKPNVYLPRNGNDIIWILLACDMRIPAVGYPAVNNIYYAAYVSYRLVHP